MNTVDTRSRKWQITINNPEEYGFTHNFIKELMGGFKSILYWCMADELGECGTYHTHIFGSFSNAVRFSTIKGKFHKAHIEMCQGTSQQNRDYIFKEGKWEKDKKRETHLPETRYEYGQIPIERPGVRNDLADLVSMIEDGMSDVEIVKESPQHVLNLDKIERYRQRVIEDRYKGEFRNVYVTYVYGKPGVGKTRSIMEKYGYTNVYRVTNYKHPFDGYKGQEVIIFDEFNSSLKITDMNQWIDGYPVELPCRYTNKVACYTKVYIISNIRLEDQYPGIQQEKKSKEIWLAFLRRLKIVKEYKSGGDVEERSIDQELWWEEVNSNIALTSNVY